MKKIPMLLCALAAILSGCEKITDINFDKNQPVLPEITREEFAKVLCSLPLGQENFSEVRDAVKGSDRNGYDEEYPLNLVFGSPGYGVGDKYITPTRAQAVKEYSVPLRDLLADYYTQACSSTKAADDSFSDISSDGKRVRTDAAAYLEALEKSDMQIYWPYYSNWDGSTAPVITFDPGVEQEANVGYVIGTGETMIVDEKTAMERPVWVINSNTDENYISSEIFTQIGSKAVVAEAQGGSGGFSQGASESSASGASAPTKADSGFKTLLLNSITALCYNDCWFAGASEYFIKIGAIEKFSASSETELKLYSPYITDFMKVIKRRDVGVPQVCDIVLVSQWTSQLESCAFMITEDDGGTQTSWKAEAIVKVNSKSYGITLTIPLNTHDDIIWRGSLGREFLEAYAGETLHMGDLDLVFDFLEY